VKDTTALIKSTQEKSTNHQR